MVLMVPPHLPQSPGSVSEHSPLQRPTVDDILRRQMIVSVRQSRICPSVLAQVFVRSCVARGVRPVRDLRSEAGIILSVGEIRHHCAQDGADKDVMPVVSNGIEEFGELK